MKMNKKKLRKIILNEIFNIQERRDPYKNNPLIKKSYSKEYEHYQAEAEKEALKSNQSITPVNNSVDEQGNSLIRIALVVKDPESRGNVGASPFYNENAAQAIADRLNKGKFVVNKNAMGKGYILIEFDQKFHKKS